MFLAACIVVFLFVILMRRIGVAVRVNVCSGRCYAAVSFLICGWELPARIRLRAEWSIPDGVRIFRMKKNGGAKRLILFRQPSDKKKYRGLLNAVLRERSKWLTIKTLKAEGGIGLKADAFYCAMLAGTLNAALKNAFEFLLKTPQAAANCRIIPAFGCDFFLLKLEGMFLVRPAQIITAALKRYFPKRGFGCYVSSHRKHHENHYGAN